MLFQAAAALLLLYLGGEALVRGGAALAMRLGVSALAVGLTVIAFGTSAPELVVSLDAALTGANDISVGNVVGSNIANVALILGLAALIRPVAVEAKVVRLDTPLMILISLALLAVLADGRASRLEGTLLFTSLIAYLTLTVWQARREYEVLQKTVSALEPEPVLATRTGAGLVIAGLALLVAGGHLLVGAAVGLATALGISQAVIGLTVVAVGTSLPELATSLVASLRGQGDIAVGNAVGSNIFNILGILGVTAMVHPLQRGDIGWSDLGIMIAASLALLLLLLTRLRLGRLEGALLVVGFATYSSTLLAS